MLLNTLKDQRAYCYQVPLLRAKIITNNVALMAEHFWETRYRQYKYGPTSQILSNLVQHLRRSYTNTRELKALLGSTMSGRMSLSCALCCCAVVLASSQTPRPNILASALAMVHRGVLQDQDEPPDDPRILKQYDFIIVGAGAAGCALANRLTEVRHWEVLLIEAGPTENFVMDVPIISNFLQFTAANWGYKTEPSTEACLGLTNHQCNYPRGKVMGGSSVLNYMIYSRGNKRDYDQWEALGNPGWGYKDVLPYFLKSEDMSVPSLSKDRTHHNKGGLLRISYPPFHTPLVAAFMEAGRETGSPAVDYNAGSQSGFSHLQLTMKNGTRWSASRAFLRPIHARKNLHVKKQSVVTKILIHSHLNKAYGVQFRRGQQRFVVHAKREVLLAAGVINSPQLLMLSGIGPKEHLRDKHIPVLKDLKVGFNLQDHVALAGLTFLVNQTVSLRTDDVLRKPNHYIEYFTYHRGPWAVPAGIEALAYYDMKDPMNPNGYPDVELLFEGSSIISDPTFKTGFGIDDDLYNSVFKPIEDAHSWMVYPMLLRPRSRGRIMLHNTHPETKPLIYHNYFSDPSDLDTIVRGVKKAIELSKTTAFQKFGSKLHDIAIPACRHLGFGSDAYWRCAARQLTFTMHHQVGTCKMGPSSDPDAVVDSRLRVHGFQGLRVIDASVIPVIPTAHINAPTYMIAEKAADMIKEDWRENNN